jgi:serine/threonine-protein kinase
VASGLHYAHTLKEKVFDEPLNIVHRDISPANIVVSYDGAVRVIDFGIAKSVTQGEATGSGLIKGKICYLSPEQVRQETLDGRSDVFSLGLVLWEMLTGRRLFASEDMKKTLDQILTSDRHIDPPAAHNSEIPRELDRIVLKSLANNRDRRYLNADELRADLQTFVSRYQPGYSSLGFGLYVTTLFKDVIPQETDRLQAMIEDLETRLATLPSEEPPSVKRRSAAPVNPAEVPTRVAPKVDRPAISKRHAAPAPAAAEPVQVLGVRGRREPSHFGRKVVAGMAAITLFGLCFWAGLRGREEIEELPAVPPSAEQVGLHPPKPAPKQPSAIIAHVPLPNPVVTRAPAPARPARTVAAAPTSTPVPVKRKVASVEPPSDILISFDLSPRVKGGQVFVNGRAVDLDGPGVRVPMDSRLEITARAPDHKPYRHVVMVDPRKLRGMREWNYDIKLEPVPAGFLTLNIDPPSEAWFEVDGAAVKLKTPIRRKKLPAGTYDLKLVNRALGINTVIKVKIHDGRETKHEFSFR